MNKTSRTKAPAFLFYASDWLTDPSLRLCSAETRGVWIDLLCLMFLSEEPGVLKIGSQILDKKGIQKLSGISQKKFSKVFDELTNFGILKQDENGRFFSKRMIQDEALRQMRRDFGKLGGNPNLKEKAVDLVENKVNQNDKQKTTPSISYSITKNKNKNILIQESETDLQEFIRKNCPSVQKLPGQLTSEQSEKLKTFAGSREAVEEILLQMENFKDLSKKYTSVFLTCNNWIKRRKNDQQQQQSNRQSGKPSFDDTIRDF
jgi:hypothetical protein